MSKFIKSALAILVFVMASCGSTKISKDLDEIDFKRQHIIELDYAFPQQSQTLNNVMSKIGNSSKSFSTQAIAIDGEGYYLEINEGKINGIFPFYGSRYSGYQSDSDQNIRFEENIDNLQIVSKTKKNNIVYKFNILEQKDSSQEYEVQIQVYSKRKIRILISSSSKSMMIYEGRMK